jgi:hypothetical protein
VSLEPATNLTGAVALVATWDATPRLAQNLSPDTPLYRDLVAATLEAEGLAEADVHIDRLQQVDLDADGVDEVLIAASHLTGTPGTPAVAAGDYALLLLQKTTNGVTVTVPLGLDVYQEANDLAYPFRYGILGLIDLTGDGWLEVIVEAERYEGRTVTVYELTPAGMQSVLEGGCTQ